MVKENIIPIENKKVQIVEIREIENYQPNWFTKTFLSTTYCCKNSLCGCGCSSRECKCKNASMWIGGDENGGFFSYSASGRKWEKDVENMDDLALKLVGEKERGVGGQVSSSVLNYRDSGGELKLLSGTAGGEFSRKSIKGKLSADLYNVKSDGVQARLGLAADTGFSVENGLEVKAVGFGFTVGDQVGISTPVGEIKVDSDKCIVQ